MNDQLRQLNNIPKIHPAINASNSCESNLLRSEKETRVEDGGVRQEAMRGVEGGQPKSPSAMTRNRKAVNRNFCFLEQATSNTGAEEFNP